VQLVRPDRRAAEGGNGGVLADQALDGVCAEAPSGAGGEQRLAGESGAFGHPDAQHRLGGRGERDGPVSAALAQAADAGAGAEGDVAAVEPGQLGDAQRPCSANAKPQTARRWATRRRPEPQASTPGLPPAKNRRPQPDVGESSRSKLPARARCTSTCLRSLSIGLPRLPRGERPPGPRGRRPGVGPVLAESAGRGRRRADVVKYWTGYCAGPGWSPARPRRCSRTWRIARYGRSSSRTTVLGLVLSLRPSAIRVFNGL
jgi:hypothetical protein